MRIKKKKIVTTINALIKLIFVHCGLDLLNTFSIYLVIYILMFIIICLYAFKCVFISFYDGP